MPGSTMTHVLVCFKPEQTIQKHAQSLQKRYKIIMFEIPDCF